MLKYLHDNVLNVPKSKSCREWRKRQRLLNWKRISNDRSIVLGSLIKCMRWLVSSIILHACERLIRTAAFHRRIPAMEIRCCRQILCIYNIEHLTDREVPQIKHAIGLNHDLLDIVRKRRDWNMTGTPPNERAKMITNHNRGGKRRRSGGQRCGWTKHHRADRSQHHRI